LATGDNTACDVAAAYALALLKSGPIKLSSAERADEGQTIATGEMPAVPSSTKQVAPEVGEPNARTRAPKIRTEVLSTEM